MSVEHKRFVLLVVVAASVTFVLILLCHSDEEISANTFALENILASNDAMLKSEKVKKIFFIESHTEKMRDLKSKRRQVCSIESAARLNPEMEIYFVLISKTNGIDMKYSESTEILAEYSNIHIRFLNPVEFSKETPLEDFFAEDKMKNSSNPIEHMSDIVRILLLNKYGGQYLDLDVLSLVPLSVINRVNFACPEATNVVTNAVINLDLEGGKAISDQYLENLRKSYNPNTWGGNGPVMFTNSIRAFCQGKNLVDNKITHCGNFTVLPRDKCYPITYGEWKKMYEENFKEEALKKLFSKDAYFLHIWNKMQDFDNKHYQLLFTSNSAYMQLAKIYCPITYESLVKIF